jgi:hypothetical protein
VSPAHRAPVQVIVALGQVEVSFDVLQAAVLSLGYLPSEVGLSRSIVVESRRDPGTALSHGGDTHPPSPISTAASSPQTANSTTG